VLAVITDNRTAVDTDSNGQPNYYEAVVAEAREYYPFGMTMPNRKTPAAGNSAYRYGFNGKENDDEAYGDDNQQDYGMRIYDPRLGRFLSVDPIAAQYPMLSSYQFASNSPVQAIDLDGLERMHYTRVSDENGKPRLEQIGQEDIVDRVVVSYRSSVSAYNDGAVPVYANKTNERQEHVVHQVRTGYVDGLDGGLGGPKEVQYDVTYTYKTYDNALKDVEGEKGNGEFLYRLAQGASFAHNENKANGGAGMAVTTLQSGAGKTANAAAKATASVEEKVVEAVAKTNSESISNFTLNDLNSFRGARSGDVVTWLEQNGWTGVRTNPNRMYNEGMRFTNGIKGEQIRIMPGGPTSAASGE
jgi:RHS repeat-associated protein